MVVHNTLLTVACQWEEEEAIAIDIDIAIAIAIAMMMDRVSFRVPRSKMLQGFKRSRAGREY